MSSPESHENCQTSDGSSYWDAPVEELSLLVLENLLSNNDPKGAGSLAATCRSWSTAVGVADELWKNALAHRWSVYKPEFLETKSPGETMAWLIGGNTAEAMKPTSPGCTWQDVYVHWSGAVEKAVWEALCLINMQPEKPQAGGGRAQLRNLWAPPASPQIDYVAWSNALDVLSKARLGPEDVSLHLLSAESPLVNLLGVHHLMALKGGCSLSVNDIASRVSGSGCRDKRVTVRWWELGSLMFGAGWRTQDHMLTAGGCIGDLVTQTDVWRILLRGTQMEVRRIVIEDDS